MKNTSDNWVVLPEAQDATAASNEHAAAHAQVADMEITRLCAEAMGMRVFIDAYGALCIEQLDILSADNVAYDPLHDDAQAMALVKKVELTIDSPARAVGYVEWEVSHVKVRTMHVDLNRAICECVAKMAPAVGGGQGLKTEPKRNGW